MKPLALGCAIALAIHSQMFARQWAEMSYYALIKRATDVLIIRVDRIDGEEYGKKAVAHIERSLKGVVGGDSIDLPFVYTGWPGPNGTSQGITEVVPVKFEAEKRYVVLISKTYGKGPNPHAAEAEYGVMGYPDRTFFAIKNDRDPQLIEIERLLAMAAAANDDIMTDSLLVLGRSDRKEERIDAIEALRNLRSERGAGVFIAMLRTDPDSSVRYIAARAMGYPQSPGIDSVLIECLKSEKSGMVRCAIVGSLGARKVTCAIPLLLGLYETEVYDVRNAILGAFPAMGDSTFVPPLSHLFSLDGDWQHRHMIAGIIAGYHTPDADAFSSRLLDSASSFWLKSAVIEGWARTNYRIGFDQIARWTSVPCSYGDGRATAKGELQMLVFPLLRAIGKLGTPEQIASALKVYADCDQEMIRRRAAEVLTLQLSNEISAQLRERIEQEIQSFKKH